MYFLHQLMYKIHLFCIMFCLPSFLLPKPQQIHCSKLFPAFRAEDIDILNTDICLLFVILVETEIQIIHQPCCGTDIQNFFFIKFPETSLAGFQLSIQSPEFRTMVRAYRQQKCICLLFKIQIDIFCILSITSSTLISSLLFT